MRIKLISLSCLELICKVGSCPKQISGLFLAVSWLVVFSWVQVDTHRDQ
jgi:hypothetical protein